MIEMVVWITGSIVVALGLIVFALAKELQDHEENLDKMHDAVKVLKRQVKCLNCLLKVETIEAGSVGEIMLMNIQRALHGTCYEKSLVLDYLLKDSEFVEEKIEPEKKTEAHFKAKEPESSNSCWVEMDMGGTFVGTVSKVEETKSPKRKKSTKKTTKKGKGKNAKKAK